MAEKKEICVKEGRALITMDAVNERRQKGEENAEKYRKLYWL